ncbi:MAG: acylneuraminate cytidylyltransferase [Alphaproteobacteria bacterium]|nr:acylneuraminate cytidylyltransferase [Alphaproteobacteria bacterium]HCP00176.1 acylneuraminate cytidylyltransferase family protein [Rhodospirillaceae bacterium]
MESVVVILARGGSRGIPRKNITNFCGKPLIAWTIEQAQAADAISSVWVSSDDVEILDVSRHFGAEVIKRPSAIANDEASSEAGWLHALDFFEAKNIAVDNLVTPQCTSPVRTPSDFDSAISIFERDSLDSLFSSTVLPDFNLWRADKSGSLNSFTYNYRRRERRQEKDEQFLENGSFWLTRPRIMREQGNRLGGNIGVWHMEFWKSFQIDEPEDLEFCETLMRHYLPDQIAP